MAKTSWTLPKSKTTPLEIYQNLVEKDRKNEKKLRMIAYVSLTGFILAIIGLLWAISLPKTVPVLVTLSDFGEAKYLGEVNKINYEGIKIPEIAIEYQIRKFVTNKYTIPGDKTVLRNNLIDCYSSLTRKSAAKMNSEINEHNPLNDVENLRRRVDIESVLALSKNSYQIDFLTTQSNPYNSNIVTARIRGVVTITLLEPSKEDKLLNPLGIYIDSYDFTQLKLK
ncbi:MAG: type IV secretion system protein [Treponema sp.]|uniref:type IV secretion system protein n=1 Tax=Treponema sp. TaxID=166 RepID=UPI00298E134B|nr:type IV secretion system protein [Treponema sp.]MCQ2596574.1 type IV secretion system protein [Treponema sp.]MCQ2601611.1 type IV secretion system protein [Treponema sp.]